jgi:hypothetical protein
MTEPALAMFQRLLLESLASGDLRPLRAALAQTAEGTPELTEYLDGFDPDAVALAVELWRKWGKRDPEG